jgi:FkbM family methyltransferase
MLEDADSLWNRLRPLYDGTVKWCAWKGLRRVINGTDTIRLLPRWRGIPEQYEPEFWRQLTGAVREGDVVVDAGAFIGLYTLAVAIRVGVSGRVIAFEPDKSNREALESHVRLNHLEERVTIRADAVSNVAGTVAFRADGTCESRIGAPSDLAQSVPCVRLDSIFPPPQRVDIVKIDVEGFEERVLDGGAALLRDSHRCPRLIFIEMHPHLWEISGTTSGSVLGKLKRFGYRVRTLDGRTIEAIEVYSNVVAVKEDLEHEGR